MNERVGYYCWAGPGTIRMINLKFFNPEIDQEDLMSSYDPNYVREVVDKLGVTDFFATFSWGFNPETEKEDQNFILDKLAGIKEAGVKVHAYVQGTNIVYGEFPDVDWFSQDQLGRPVTYHRGRRCVCINNPGFVSYKMNQVEEMTSLGFDGIYMDNIQMGQLGIPTFGFRKPYVFAGCTCRYCQEKFRELYGLEIPRDFEKDQKLTEKYLEFRVNSVSNFLRGIAEIVRAAGLEFGTNSFEPRFDNKYVFGTDLKELDNIQDYLLFENHSLPDNAGRNNKYIHELSKGFSSPVFVVSYRGGIGSEPAFSQEDLDNIYTESAELDFFPCYKGSEFVTEGLWHNLRIGEYRKPTVNPEYDFERQSEFDDSFEIAMMKNVLTRRFLKRFYNPLLRWFMEKKTGRKFFMWLNNRALH